MKGEKECEGAVADIELLTDWLWVVRNQKRRMTQKSLDWEMLSTSKAKQQTLKQDNKAIWETLSLLTD